MKYTIFLLLTITLILPVSVRAGILSEYTFDEDVLDTGADGVVADDLQPTASYTSQNDIEYACGVVGRSVRVGDGRLYATDSTDLDLAGIYTIEAFINPVANDESRRIFAAYGDVDSYKYVVTLGNGGKLHFLHVQSGGASVEGWCPSAVINTDQWHHIAIVADGTNINYHVDGNPVPVHTLAYDGTLKQGDHDLGVGEIEGYGNFVYYGLIDEVRFHNVAVNSTYLASRLALLDNLNYRAINPDPADNTISDANSLTWQSPGTVISPAYDVYLGTDLNSMAQVATGLTDPSYTPGLLAPGTIYYWAVDTHDGGNTYPGGIWSFIASGEWGAAYSPADGALSVPVNTDLSWPTSGSVDRYEVYFGTDFSAVQLATNSATTCSPEFLGATLDPNIFNDSLPVLAENATYYWRVDMVVGSSTISGSILSFETGVSEVIAIPPSARNPYPAMQASDVSVKDGLTLLWEAGNTVDPVMSYNLLASENSDLSNPVLDVNGLTSPEYPWLPECLNETVTYYWRVDEVTSTQTITGSVWNFTTHVPECANPPVSDITGDCVVNFNDFAAMAAVWLEVTSFKDLSIMADEWLDCGMALAEDCH